jgi:uncharacterized protein YndB with AHSA1/START domain
MTAVTTETDIAAPREKVFDLLLDPHRLGEWVSAHRSVSDVPGGKLEQGSEFEQTLSLAGREFHVRWRVTELEAPRLAVWEGRGPARSKATVRYELSENGDGTRFLYCNDYALPGGPVGAAAGGAVSVAAKRAMKTTLKRLKKLLEADRGA